MFELDTKLGTVACAGASSVRDALLKRTHALLAELNKLGALSENDQRTGTVGKSAQADLALERGHLEEAQKLYLEVLADTQWRAAIDPTNAVWQGDLATADNKLGNVAMSAGRLDDARGWSEKGLAVATVLAAAEPSNRERQRDLSRTAA